MAKKQKVAIIEDDFFIRDVYQKKFEIDGYAVGVAADGMEGMELIESFEPDIVLLDLMMPRLSGIDMLAQMHRDNKPLPKTAILTNITDDAVRQQAINLGVTDFVIKSEISLEDLSSFVKSRLSAG